MPVGMPMSILIAIRLFPSGLVAVCIEPVNVQSSLENFSFGTAENWIVSGVAN